VSAKDRATSKEQRITISGQGTLDKSEVERMVRDAEQNATADQEFRDRAEARNQADATVLATERTLKDLGEKVPTDLHESIDTAIANVKSAMEGDDTARIKSTTEELQQASYRLSEMLYQQADAAGAAGDSHAGGETPEGAAETHAPQDDVIDAEFKSE
jgi:molecular chaperone DnaK